MQGKVAARLSLPFTAPLKHGWEKWSSFQSLSRSLRPLPTYSSVQRRESVFSVSPTFVRFEVVLVPLNSASLGQPQVSNAEQYFELRLRWAGAVTGEAPLGPVLLVVLKGATIMKEIWHRMYLQRCWGTFIWYCFHRVPWSYYWFHLH